MENNDYLHMEEYERHAQGLMSPEEVLSFNKKLNQDQAFSQGYEAYLEMQQFLEVKDEISEGKNIIAATRKENTTHNTEKQSSFNKILLAICALFLLITALYFLNKKGEPSHQALYATYFEPPSISLETKGPEREIAKEKMIEVLSNYYNIKNYEEAYINLDTSLLSQRNKIDVTIAKGFSALMTEREQEGLNLLLPLAEKSTNLADEIYWIIGMDQIRKGNVDRGIEYLNKLSSGSNNKDKADDVISKLS